MIRLINLLLEINNQPKAIFLAGSAGSGKSSTYKLNPDFPTQLDNLLPSSYNVINDNILTFNLPLLNRNFGLPNSLNVFVPFNPAGYSTSAHTYLSAFQPVNTYLAIV